MGQYEFITDPNKSRFGGQHYLVPVQPVSIETEYCGFAADGLQDGSYIEQCECHPDRLHTRYVEVVNGLYYESDEVMFHLIQGQ